MQSLQTDYSRNLAVNSFSRVIVELCDVTAVQFLKAAFSFLRCVQRLTWRTLKFSHQAITDWQARPDWLNVFTYFTSEHYYLIWFFENYIILVNSMMKLCMQILINYEHISI